jgi:hypothetical protein
MPVRTVFPRHVTSRGNPTLIEINLPGKTSSHPAYFFISDLPVRKGFEETYRQI